MRQEGLCTCHKPPKPMHREIVAEDFEFLAPRGHIKCKFCGVTVESGEFTPGHHRYDCPTQQEVEWEHDDDETYAEVFHVHIHHAASDCDGPIEHWSTQQITSLNWDYINAGRTTVTPNAHDLWVKLAEMEAPLGSPCEVKVTETDYGTLNMEWYQRTDEGYSGGDMQGCKDPECAHDGASQRDMFAERMGY